ncbi:MAG: alpha-L-fucosidase [Armatimonadota bacterium]|nr:alpha-L-fucosidase [Armatimonadota bacterium]
MICCFGSLLPKPAPKAPQRVRMIDYYSTEERMSDTIPSYEERMKWFHQARFGMFIHWGLYSIPARGEWVMYQEQIPAADYAHLAKKFNPKKLDAASWVALAKEAGMKYMVLTTRHHDGFCLFDSQVSDFTSVKTAAKRDIVREYVDAARAGGMKVGFYYSWLDWRFPGYFDYKGKPESAKALVRQAHDQVKELMTNYGKIDVLWYDGHWVPNLEKENIAEFWGAKEMNAMVRKLQPHILINNRSGLAEDLDTPEQHVTASAAGRGWESCMTMGDSCGWGFIANNPNFKTVPQIIQHLVTAAAGEGNFLLNCGPKSDGTIRKEESDRLKAIGEWMAANGESIYGSERTPFRAGIMGICTAKGNNVYLHIFRWPIQGEACIPNIKNKIKKATILQTGQNLEIVKASNNRTYFRGLPKKAPHPYDTVIKLELDGKPEALTPQWGYTNCG